MAIGNPDDLRRHALDLLRRNDEDGLVALLERNPGLIRFISGRDAQEFLVNRPEQHDYNQEQSAVNQAMEQQGESQRARNDDLVARLAIDPSFAGRFRRDAEAQTRRHGAAARRSVAAEFEQRRNTPTRNAAPSRIFDAAERGYAKQGQTASNIASGAGTAAGIAGAILSVAAAAPTAGASLAALAPLGAGLTAGGAAVGSLGKATQEAEASRRAMQLGRQRRAATSHASRQPSYTSMFPQLQQQFAPETLTIDPLNPQDDDSGFAWG